MQTKKGDHTIVAFGLGDCLSPLLEFFCKGLVVEEDVGIIEFVVPRALEIAHGVDQIVKFLIADERDNRGIGTGRLFAVGRIIVVFGSPEFTCGFTSCYSVMSVLESRG